MCPPNYVQKAALYLALRGAFPLPPSPIGIYYKLQGLPTLTFGASGEMLEPSVFPSGPSPFILSLF
jgi:hypothetical protein